MAPAGGAASRPSWDPRNVFTGTAAYYARYRPQYPDQVFDLLRDRFNLSGASRVLDLGCGPGHVALKLAPFVGAVYAVDPQEEMLAEGRRLAEEGGIANIEWLPGQSAGLPQLAGRIGPVDLTVMGRSFHWMDREQTLRDLYTMTTPGGGIALLADSGNDPEKRTPWRDIVWETVKHWLGEQRRAGTGGTYDHPEKRHQEVVASSSFTGLETVGFELERVWTPDGIVGYLYSTSLASLPVLGEKKEPFEADLRKRLAECEPSGRFTETVTMEILMAWKR